MHSSELSQSASSKEELGFLALEVCKRVSWLLVEGAADQQMGC